MTTTTNEKLEAIRANRRGAARWLTDEEPVVREYAAACLDLDGFDLGPNIIVAPDVTLLGCARGSYQQLLIDGLARWSGGDLHGRARSYGASYSRSRIALLNRISERYATEWIYVGPHRQRTLVVRHRCERCGGAAAVLIDEEWMCKRCCADEDRRRAMGY